jgi:hypothetical protein
MGTSRKEIRRRGGGWGVRLGYPEPEEPEPKPGTGSDFLKICIVFLTIGFV